MKVITHPGTFHADEISAIAFLFSIGIIPKGTEIERREPTLDDLSDANTIVLDIGGIYNPELNNFDHHQDASLNATNILVLEEAKYVLDPKVINSLKERLFSRISNIDRGLETSESYEFTSLVRSFNNKPNGFKKAVAWSKELIDNIILDSMSFIESEKMWSSLDKIKSKDFTAVVVYSEEQILGWKTLAEKDNVQFLIGKSNRGGWNMITISSEKFPIPSSPKQTFLHNSGFLANYASIEDAIDDFHKIKST